MIDCPTIAAKIREAKKAPPNDLDVVEPKKNHFYHLQARIEIIRMKVPVSYSFLCAILDRVDEPLLSGGVWRIVGC